MITSYRPQPLTSADIGKEIEAALMCLDEGNTARTGLILHRILASLTIAKEKAMLIQNPPDGMGPFGRLPPV
jgi:hypothetical protein